MYPPSRRSSARAALGVAALAAGFAFSALAQAPQENEAPSVVLAPQQPQEAAVAGEAPKSLLFTPEEIAALHEAIRHFLGRDPRRANLLKDKEKTEAKESKYYIYPQFYLESIVYHGSDSWLVWVNGQKFTPEATGDKSDLRIVEVTEDHAGLEWKPLSMDKIDESLSKSASSDAQIDHRRGTVAFTLHTNQTFSSYTMRVLEGKVLPVVVDVSMGDQRPVVTPPEQPVQESGASNEGLDGLMHYYQEIDKQSKDMVNGGAR